RPDNIGGKQAKLLIIENDFWFDRLVVRNRGYSVRLAGANRSRCLHRGERTAYALIGDAPVRAFEAMADADVTQHVVGEMLQQQQRIYGIGIFLAKNFDVAGSRGHRGEELMVAAVMPAARPGAYEQSCAVVESGRAVRIERI